MQWQLHYVFINLPVTSFIAYNTDLAEKGNLYDGQVVVDCNWMDEMEASMRILLITALTM